MQRQRGELVPVGEALADLGGPVQALREASPQAHYHFTLSDQVNQLVSASEADPDLGFMGRTMALCSLPRTNPGNRLQYVRRNGPYQLYMIAGGGNKLPYGSLPAAPDPGLGVHRSGADPKPRTRSRPLALGVHEDSGYLQHQRRKPGRPDAAPQPNAAAFQCSCPVGLQG